jgi:hypothetical protein
MAEAKFEGIALVLLDFCELLAFFFAYMDADAESMQSTKLSFAAQEELAK